MLESGKIDNPQIMFFHDQSSHYLCPVGDIASDKVDVFISYSNGDEPYVNEIAYCLTELNRCLGLSITYCTDINHKHDSTTPCDCSRVAYLIEECRVYIHIGSKHADNSDYAFRKVHHAVDVIEKASKEERDKAVLTLLDGDPHDVLPPALMFLLSNVNHRQKINGVFPVLIKDITRQLGLEPKSVSAQSKYDVFISYSHADVGEVHKLADALDYDAISYFIYENDISGGENYLEEISHAIDTCKAFIFVASNDSFQSKYALKELCYAINSRGGSAAHVIVYNPKSAAIPPSVALMIGGAQMARAYSDVYKALQILYSALSHPIYKSGQVAEFGSLDGLVFSAYGEYGIAIALNDYKCQWSVDSPIYSRELLGKAYELMPEGCVDGDLDGFVDRRYFKRYPLSLLTYPAYGTCVDNGSLWHLPNIVELQFLPLAELNTMLTKEGAEPIKLGQFYWSSTEWEGNSEYAFGCVFKSADSYGEIVIRKKTEVGLVRPVVSFGYISRE